MMPMQGLSAVANMIMNLVEPETWDRMAFMRGMMGAMGGGGMMGGMGGGGMGGMGGGMGGMGGMGGGGFRSVPPADLPTATLAPGQSRGLKTRLVRLGGPNAEGGVDFPAKGEPLTLGDVGQTEAAPKVQAALRRLARDCAPEAVSQVALWAAAGMPWDDVAKLSRNWASPQELALAKAMVADLDAKDQAGDTGRLLIEVTAKADAQKGLADQLAAAFRGRSMLGLAVEGSVPTRPAGPAVACKVQIGGTAEKPEASVQLASSDANASAWAPVGKFELPMSRDDAGKLKAEAFGDALAEGLLDRLVKVSVRKGAASTGLIPAAPKTAGAYGVRIENYSPLLLNKWLGATSGMKAKVGEPAKVLLGLSLSPRRTFAVPITAESVEKYGLKNVKAVALDLSGLWSRGLRVVRPGDRRPTCGASVPLGTGGRSHSQTPGPPAGSLMFDRRGGIYLGPDSPRRWMPLCDSLDFASLSIERDPGCVTSRPTAVARSSSRLVWSRLPTYLERPQRLFRRVHATTQPVRPADRWRDSGPIGINRPARTSKY